jgi:hypothetical protein
LATALFIATAFFLTLIVWATCVLPRRLGWPGLVFAHALTVIVVVGFGTVEVVTGRTDFELKLLAGWIFAAIVVNALLLPIGVLGVARARPQRQDPRGFPVVPTVPTPDQSHADAVRDTLPADDRA